MRTSGFVYVFFVYALALAVAAVAAEASPTTDPLLRVAFADFCATVVVFVASRRANNSSVYDPYWSVVPIAIAVWFARAGDLSPRAIFVLAGVVVWGGRLTWNWARGWPGLQHEDWRYVDIRRQTGRLYWPASFLAIHFFPSVLTYLGSLPLLPAITSTASLGALDAAGAVIVVAAIALETIADEQLRKFRREHSAGSCEVGLWRYSRHPNYFGEILFWIGLWVFGLVGGAPGWMAVGPVAILALFLFASIPLMEKRALARRPDYTTQVAKVSTLVPWFRKD